MKAHTLFEKSALFFAAMLLVLFSAGQSFAGVPQKISYQGYLVNELDEPLTGSYSVLFSIYDVQTGGTALWNETRTVSVESGVFNIKLGEVNTFPAGLFDDPRYIGIKVESDPEMTPRQEITSTAFSFRAENSELLNGMSSSEFALAGHEHDAEYINTGEADSVTSSMIIDSSIGISHIANGTVLDEILDDDGSGSGLDADRLDGLDSSSFFNLTENETVSGIPAFTGGTSGSTSPFTVDSNTRVSSLNADYLDGFHGASYVRNTQDYGRSGVSSNLYEGSSTLSSKYVNESGDSMSGSSTSNILSVTNTYSGTTGESAAIFATSDGHYTTGAVIGQATGSSGDAVYGQATGKYGIGVKGASQGDFGFGVYGYSEKNYGVYGLSSGTTDGTSRAVYGVANNFGDVENYGGYFQAFGDKGRGVYGYAADSGSVTNYGGYFKSNGQYGKGGYFETTGQYGFALFAKKTYGDSQMYARLAGGGTAVTGYYDTYSYGQLGTSSYGVNAQNGKSGGYGGRFYAYGTNGTGIYAKCTSSGGWAGVFQGKVKIQNSGGQTVMEMGEGLDYAEGFNVTDPLKVTPGTVMIIDSENPGRLSVSFRPYDKRVAGIVAGANNMGSGVRLGAGQFDNDVALAGRVYCNVDATNTPIEAGDLLTTSGSPGYAMKACDHDLAQGAILGKAMQKLERGNKEKILVLVTLQ